MSTKIYNGYLLDVENIMDIFALQDTLRELIKDKMNEIHTRKIAKQATDYLDAVTLGKGAVADYARLKGDWCALTTATMELMERVNKHEKSDFRSDSEFDYSFSVNIGHAGGKILALLGTEQNEFTKVFESLDCVTPYPYWNNTDRPDNVTEAEWEKRCEDWNEALRGDIVYNNTTLAIKFTSYGMIGWGNDVDAVLQHIPSKHDRANAIARAQLFNERHKEELQAIYESGTYHGFGAIAMGFKDWHESSEGQEIAGQRRDEIASKLPDVDEALLKKDLGEFENFIVYLDDLPKEESEDGK